MGKLGTKAIPLRRCRVCRTQLPKVQLNRWVLVDGILIADETQKKPGRGFYTDKPLCAEKLALVIKKTGR